MLCMKCGKNEANYHIKTVVNGQLSEAHLCHECAAANGVGNMLGMNMGIGNIFEGFFEGNPFFGSVSGMKPGYGGNLTANMQPAMKIGFQPNEVDMIPVREETPLEEKRRLLDEAISKENYEQAAVLRDEIKALGSE